MQGLQIWGADGAVILDTTTNTSRVLGIVPNVGLHASSGSVTDARFATGRPFAMLSPRSIGNTPFGYPMTASVDITISGTTLTWASYSGAGLDCGTIVFGVY